VGTAPASRAVHYTSSTPYTTWSASNNAFTGINSATGTSFSYPLGIYLTTVDTGAAGNNVASSTTGTAGWATLSAVNCPVSVPNKSTWGGNKFIIAQTSATNALYSSALGTTCTAITPNVFTTGANNVEISEIDSVWVAVGAGTNSIAFSTDNGVTFTGLGTSVFSTAGFAIGSTGSQESFRRRAGPELLYSYRNKTR
jgi:hypothetical protein